MTSQAFRLIVDDWLGEYHECNECQEQANWLVCEVGQDRPTFRCALHLWYAFDRVTSDLRSHDHPSTGKTPPEPNGPQADVTNG